MPVSADLWTSPETPDMQLKSTVCLKTLTVVILIATNLAVALPPELNRDDVSPFWDKPSTEPGIDLSQCANSPTIECSGIGAILLCDCISSTECVYTCTISA